MKRAASSSQRDWEYHGYPGVRWMISLGGGLDIPGIAVNVPSEEKQAGKLPDKSSWTASPYAPESISSRVSSHRPVVHCDRVQCIAATVAQTLVDSAIPYQQCLPLKSPNLPRRFR